MMLPVGCNPIKIIFCTADATGVVSFERNEFAHRSFGNEQSEADKHICIICIFPYRWFMLVSLVWFATLKIHTAL